MPLSGTVLVSQLLTLLNKYFKLKKLVGLLPHSNYLLSSIASDDNMSNQCNRLQKVRAHLAHTFTQAWTHRHRHTVQQHVKTVQLHTESTSTQFHSGIGTQTQTNGVTTFQTMQPHTESTSTHSFTQAWEHRDKHIYCALIFLSLNLSSLELYQTIWPVMHVKLPSLNTIKNAVTSTQTGRSSRCLVKAEESSFEYKQRALLEASYLYVFSAFLREIRLANLKIDV